MSVRACRIGTVVSAARLHVAEAKEGSGNCWSKICKVHIIAGWQVDSGIMTYY